MTWLLAEHIPSSASQFPASVEAVSSSMQVAALKIEMKNCAFNAQKFSDGTLQRGAFRYS